MKILKIRFENIHSLKGEHEVNFGEGILGEAGLFAITGPTGSGKSTLLDVITLALYNRIARVDKAVSNTILEDDGGIMTRNMRSCYAEVEYRVNGRDYRSHWSIERNRNNNLNQRKQELVEVATGHILESGTKTPEKNQEIIGLSYEQFVKAMVLSQGEFSKLLQAPRNERNKLLEDITGARSYREIGRAVFFRYSGVKKEIELKEAGLEGIQLLTPGLIAEKNTELKTLTESKPKVEKAYQAASEKIKIREELQKKQGEHKGLENEKLKLAEDYKVFDPYKVKLTNHERLSKYSDNLRDYDSAVREVNQLNEQLNNLHKSKAGAETLQTSYLKAVTALLKEKVDIKTANQKLEAFRNKITTLQAEEKKKEGEATLFQNQLNGFVRNINQLDYELSKPDSPDQFTSEFKLFEKSIEEIIANSGAKSIDELNSQLDNSRELNEKAGDFLVKKEQALKFHKNLETLKNKLKTEEESIIKDSRTIESSRKEIATLSEEVEKLEKNLEQHRKHQNLEQYRLQLEPDQPCPLCGSLEHPYASEEPYFDSQEELLKEKKNSLKSKSELVIALSEKNKFQLKNISNLKSETQTTSEEEVKNEIALLELAKSL
ncbi:MAG TPA: AAA family ATPase [Aequorivita sp.]|nr:AAA family ATPase [Aequorivita sp.]